MLTHAAWARTEGLHHGFLGRAECADAIGWEGVVAAAGAQLPIVIPRQVHGTRVLAATPGTTTGEGDAVVAATPGVVVGVVTADCVPVLLTDAERRLAAAVHAGWRGMSAGILAIVVRELAVRFGAPPGALEVVIGPAIGGCCYEVGDDVLIAFRAGSGDITAPAWERRGPRRVIDLRLAAALLLGAAGVARVTVLGPCTACAPGYFSYRRDGAGGGRQLSFIGWA